MRPLRGGQLYGASRQAQRETADWPSKKAHPKLRPRSLCRHTPSALFTGIDNRFEHNPCSHSGMFRSFGAPGVSIPCGVSNPRLLLSLPGGVIGAKSRPRCLSGKSLRANAHARFGATTCANFRRESGQKPATSYQAERPVRQGL